MRAVLFDLDGVFVESRAVWFQVMREIARKFGYPDISAEQMELAWGQGIADDARNFYPGMTIDQLEREYNLLFPENVRHLIVEPHGAETVKCLRANGISIAVVTNSPTEVARAMLNEAQVAPDVLVCGTDVALPKPAPDGILKALALLGIVADEGMFVGDTRYDREAAQRAGIRFVGYRIDGDDRIESLPELTNLI